MRGVTENLQYIQQLITEYAQQYGRDPASVQLLAVSKRQPVEKMAEAIRAGQTRFGESYLQEALPKIVALTAKTTTPLEWHFIGPIQSNKTRLIAEHFDWVHSVSTGKVARRLSEQRPAHLPPLNICIEVNISGEATKSGVSPAETLELATFCQSLPGLRLRGLMAIPAPAIDVPTQRQAFHELVLLQQSLIREGLTLDTLSMGMSEDFEAAIAEGSTIVRIGTAIFGSR